MTWQPNRAVEIGATHKKTAGIGAGTEWKVLGANCREDWVELRSVDEPTVVWIGPSGKFATDFE